MKLNGYHPFEHLPGTSQNSGCGLYIKNNITYYCREDLFKSFSITSCEFEALWVEIISKKGPNILIAIIYRHPDKSDIKSFLHYLEQCFNKIRAENKIITIMGDFNLDLLNCDSHSDTDDFLAMMLSIFFQPHIIQPTHFLPSGKSTLIDNIFINSLEYECTSGNLIPHVTDHLPNFLSIKKFQFSQSWLKRKTRDFSKFNTDDFINDANNLQLDEKGNNGENVNQMYDIFHDELEKLINKHAPMKTISIRKQKQHKKPWITNGILKSISIKNKLYGTFMKTGNHSDRSQYKLYRDRLNHIIRKSKYNKNYFAKYKSNIKKIWSGIKELLGSSGQKNGIPLCLNINGEITSDPKSIAEKFNMFFVNIAPSVKTETR